MVPGLVFIIKGVRAQWSPRWSSFSSLWEPSGPRAGLHSQVCECLLVPGLVFSFKGVRAQWAQG